MFLIIFDFRGFLTFIRQLPYDITFSGSSKAFYQQNISFHFFHLQHFSWNGKLRTLQQELALDLQRLDPRRHRSLEEFAKINLECFCPPQNLSHFFQNFSFSLNILKIPIWAICSNKKSRGPSGARLLGSVTEKKEQKKKDWSWSILVVGLYFFYVPQKKGTQSSLDPKIRPWTWKLESATKNFDCFRFSKKLKCKIKSSVEL